MAYYMQWIYFFYSILWETMFCFSVLQMAFLKAFKKTWERKDQLVISEIILRAQSSKLLLN